jgi:predicted anti-sigma-YlaC factor YlaD
MRALALLLLVSTAGCAVQPLAAARTYTQYAYAVVQQDADEAEDENVALALYLQDRARGLYRRGRDHGLRGLRVSAEELRREPRRVVASAQRSDVALLYWTGASWGALIALSKEDPEALADVPAVEALIDRALELDESFERGAIHTFLITYEMVRQGAAGDAADRARKHFARAVELSGGADAAPMLALAEAVCVPAQRRLEFEELLERALSVEGGDRLANLVMQRRARWLRARTDRLFID